MIFSIFSFDQKLIGLVNKFKKVLDFKKQEVIKKRDNFKIISQIKTKFGYLFYGVNLTILFLTGLTVLKKS